MRYVWTLADIETGRTVQGPTTAKNRFSIITRRTKDAHGPVPEYVYMLVSLQDGLVTAERDSKEGLAAHLTTFKMQPTSVLPSRGPLLRGDGSDALPDYAFPRVYNREGK